MTDKKCFSLFTLWLVALECSYLEGDRLTQAHSLNHQVAMKMNPGDQSQVLKDQQGIRTHNSRDRQTLKPT